MPPLFLLALVTGVGLVDTIPVGVAVSGRIKDGECLHQCVDTRYKWSGTGGCGIYIVQLIKSNRDDIKVALYCELKSTLGKR